MNNLNSLIIEGNLSRDPVLREPTQDFKVCSFPIAVNRWYKNKKGTGEEEVSYFDVETYGKMAEICKNKLKVGNGVRVVGRLKQNRWEDSETGKTKSSIYVIAEHIEFKPVFNPSTKNEKSEVTEKNETTENIVIPSADEKNTSAEQVTVLNTQSAEVLF